MSYITELSEVPSSTHPLGIRPGGDTGALVEVVSPEVTPAVQGIVDAGGAVWHGRRYRAGDLDGAWYVLACTSDAEVNALVTADATERQRLYSTAEGLVSIELRNNDVVIVEGAQDAEQLKRLSDRLWRRFVGGDL